MEAGGSFTSVSHDSDSPLTSCYYTSRWSVHLNWLHQVMDKQRQESKTYCTIRRFNQLQFQSVLQKSRLHTSLCFSDKDRTGSEKPVGRQLLVIRPVTELMKGWWNSWGFQPDNWRCFSLFWRPWIRSRLAPSWLDPPPTEERLNQQHLQTISGNVETVKTVQLRANKPRFQANTQSARPLSANPEQPLFFWRMLQS